MQSNAQTVLIKLSDTYNVCCHGNSCAYGLHTSYKTGYLISNAFVNTECAYVCSLCNCIHIFCGFSMGRNQYWARRVYDLCVYYMRGTPKGSTKSGFMEKPGIEPATPGLQGIALIHYTTGQLYTHQIYRNMEQS